MVYVLPLSMYYHCLCTTIVYVLPLSMSRVALGSLGELLWLLWGDLGLPVAPFGVALGSLGGALGPFGTPWAALGPSGLDLRHLDEHMGRISAACHQNMASWNLPGGPGGPGGPGTLRRSGVTKCC